MRLRAWIGAVLLAAWLVGGVILPPGVAHAQDDRPVVVLLRLEGQLTAEMETYLQRGFSMADELNAACVVIELNTPGGSVALMEQIIADIRNYNRPVIVYVSPRGAMAGSAGTLITLAGHLSAMAPETLIGAASPVGSQGEDIGDTMEAKVKQVMKASARNLTASRSLAAQTLAEDMIDKATAVTVDQALKIGLIDIKAVDLSDLLTQADGRVVLVLDQERTLSTLNAQVEEVPENFIDQALRFLTNPNLVFILLVAGVQAILIELSSPGGWVAGFAGVVMLLLAIYGMGFLPVNWFGMLFIVIAFILFAMDVRSPTHGALTAAGIGALVAGALILFNSVRVPGFEGVSVPLVITTALVVGMSFSMLVAIGLRAQKTPVQMGSATMIGKKGVIRSAGKRMQVQVAGELWTAVALTKEPSEELDQQSTLMVGDYVRVAKIDGLRLMVEKVEEDGTDA